MEAANSAVSLQEHIEMEVLGDPDLTTRLEGLETMPGTSWPVESINSLPAPQSGDATPRQAPSSPKLQPEPNSQSAIDGLGESFEIVLLSTRVYDRVKHRESDATSTIQTSRSHAWSIVSGISLSQISIIAVIKLPLHEAELKRFMNLATADPGPAASEVDAKTESISSTPEEVQKLSILDQRKEFFKRWSDTAKSAAGRRICKELWDMELDPPTSCVASPTDDNLVMCPPTPKTVSKRLTGGSSIGKELSWDP